MNPSIPPITPVPSICDFARRVLLARTLDAKLECAPPQLRDDDPGGEPAPAWPARPPGLEIETDARRKKRVPSILGMRDPAQRLRILHALANHELQAVELFAWALLAFPSAPKAFRSGVLRILGEEQLHLRLYLGRIEALGGRFGDFPLSGYFWTRARAIATPLQFVCAMCLTFENANLDHAQALAAAADAAGDAETAAVLRRVHEDEVGHVRFGWHWLAEWKAEEQSMTEAWSANVNWPLRPALARGDAFVEESRRQAGFDDEFIALLRDAERPRALYRFEKPSGVDGGGA